MASEISETSHSDIDPNTQALHQPHHEFHGYIPQQTPMPALSQPPTMTTVIPPIPTAPESSQMASPYGLQHPPLGVQGQPIEQESTGGGTSTILAVTNLPYRIRWQDLKDLFRRYGTPSRADVFLAPDGRSRGVGMVTMRTRREAENCVNDLNGYEWYGRKIGVRIDETGGHHALAAAAMAGATIWDGVGIQQDYEAASPQLQGYQGAAGTANPYLSQSGSPMLYVGNLPFSTQWQDLKDLLRPAGRILRADIALAPDGRSKGWGTAVFATPQEAQHAIDTFDGWEVDGRIIKVRWDKFQGSAPPAESPSQAPAAAAMSTASSMMQTQMSPTQTPRPGEFAPMVTSPQGLWASQYPASQMRPMAPPVPPIAGPSGLQTSSAGIPMTSPQPAYGQTFMHSPYMPPLAGSSSVQTQQTPPGQYPVGMSVYNPQAGWFPSTYGTPAVQHPPLPQVRLPSASIDQSQIPFPPTIQSQSVQRTDQSPQNGYSYGSTMYTNQ